MRKSETNTNFSYQNQKSGRSFNFSRQKTEVETTGENNFKPREKVNWGVIMALMAVRIFLGG